MSAHKIETYMCTTCGMALMWEHEDVFGIGKLRAYCCDRSYTAVPETYKITTRKRARR